MNSLHVWWMTISLSYNINNDEHEKKSQEKPKEESDKDRAVTKQESDKAVKIMLKPESKIKHIPETKPITQRINVTEEQKRGTDILITIESTSVLRIRSNGYTAD